MYAFSSRNLWRLGINTFEVLWQTQQVRLGKFSERRLVGEFHVRAGGLARAGAEAEGATGVAGGGFLRQSDSLINAVGLFERAYRHCSRVPWHVVCHAAAVLIVLKPLMIIQKPKKCTYQIRKV